MYILGHGFECIWCINVAVAWLTVGQLVLAVTDFGSDWPDYGFVAGSVGEVWFGLAQTGNQTV